MKAKPYSDHSKTRAEKYQYLFFECSIPIEVFESSDNSRSIQERMGNGFYYDEKETLLNLYDQLTAQFWRLAKEELTEKQLNVMILASQGYTQDEMAKILNKNQSSVFKMLKGQMVKKKITGGAIPKMKEAIKKDLIIQELLTLINEETYGET